VSLLFIGAIFGLLATIWILNFLSFSLPFGEVVRKFPDIISISFIASMLSFMFPAAVFASNECKWGHGSSSEIFFMTSFLIFPLFIVFPLDQYKLQEVFISSKDAWSLYLVLWFIHGLINSLHVSLLQQR
jgi:hypothetical protein